MADDETYCRLCAEPTHKDQLISPDEDVAINSKIIVKLLWINIDISSESPLPNTICFSCFDLLERTWTFLKNTQDAHTKLTSIFIKNINRDTNQSVNDKNAAVPGKPSDTKWEDFQEKKVQIKIEDDALKHKCLLEGSNKIKSNSISVKSENESDEDFNLSDCNGGSDHIDTSDSDIPLEITAKKKRSRPKKVCNNIFILDSLKEEIPLEILTTNTTWETLNCKCAKCNAVCENISMLQLHSVEIHNRCCMFKCASCNEILNSFKSFVRHVRIHNKSLRHCCEYCNKLFISQPELRQHRTKYHTGIHTTKCRSCGSDFDTVEELQDHKLLYGKGLRKKHKIEQLSESDLKCNDCGKVFKSRNNLHQHKQVHLERTRNFSCHVCGKMFFTKGALGTHILTHNDTKPFKCDYCPLTFRARGNLKSHISLHSGVKPFVCEQCGKSFRVKRHLKSHSIIHTDLMPYVCEYCNKSFRFKTRLNLHVRQHTGAKPYTCIYCQRDFTNGSNYKKHMKRRHGIDTSRQKYNNIAPNKEENDIKDNLSQSAYTE